MLKVIFWIDYDNYNFDTAEGSKEELEAVSKNIKENGYKFGGDDHENHPLCCPVLSNGKALRLSWRNWGYVMALAYNLKTKDNDYNYILWYMGEYGPEERKFPKDQKIDLSLITDRKHIIYELDHVEYDPIHNVSFTCLIFPYEYLNSSSIHSGDILELKLNNRKILEVMINEIRFVHLSFDEFFDESFSFYENSNFAKLSKETVRQLLIQKYKEYSEHLVVLCFDIIDDNRENSLLHF